MLSIQNEAKHNEPENYIVQKNILILQAFLHNILNSTLSDKIKHHAEKIITCFVYIAENLSLIEFAVDNKNLRGLYRFRDDQKNGVLRDPENTAFHIHAYEDGKEAVKSLCELIASLSNLLERLKISDQLIFAEKMQWDKKRGCLEARIAPALMWATIALDIPLLDDVMAKYLKSINHAVPDIEAFLKFCQSENPPITKVAYNGNYFNINKKVVADYLEDIFGSKEEDTDKKTEYPMDEKNSHALTPKSLKELLWHASAIVTDDDTCHFIDEKIAQQVSLLTKSDILKINGYFIVNVSKSDINKIFKNPDWIENLLQELYPSFIYGKDLFESDHLLEWVQNNSMDVVSFASAQYKPGSGSTFKKALLSQPPKVISTLIDKIYPQTFNEIILAHTKNYNSTLRLAASVSLPSFDIILQKIMPATLDKGLLQENKKLIGIIAAYNKPNTFFNLIQKASANVLLEVLEKNLAMIINTQSSNNIIFLFKKLATYDRSELINILYKKIIYSIAQYQPPETMAVVLDILLHAEDTLDHYDINLICFKALAFYHPVDLLLNFLSILPKDSLNALEKSDIKNYHFRTAVRAMLIKLSNYNIDKNTAVMQFISNTKKSLDSFEFKHGPLKKVLKEDEKQVIDLVIKGQAVIKIVLDKDYPDMLKKLNDYNFRPIIRYPISNAKFKYVHHARISDLRYEEKKQNYTEKELYHPDQSTAHIVTMRNYHEIRQHKNKKKQRGYCGTKKNSGTLISSTMTTGFFGLHHQDRDQVGLLFALQNNKIKAMFSEDRGTYMHRWVSDKYPDIINYSNQMRYCSFGDFNVFRERVKISPYVTNEIQISFKRTTCRSIVIARDSKSAREKAYARHKQKLDEDLPIVILNPEEATILVPDLELLDIKSQIESQVSILSFFSAKTYRLKPTRFSNFDCQLSRDKAHAILEIIQQESQQKISYEEACEAVGNKINFRDDKVMIEYKN